MQEPKPLIRLFVPAAYAGGASLTLPAGQSHYLMHVMRLKEGDSLAVFNGADGEWLVRISLLHKKHAMLQLQQPRAPQRQSPDVWLALAPIKSKTDLLVEKATELGVSKIISVITRHCVVKSVNDEKLLAHAIEAAEQCERHDVPQLEARKDLGDLLSRWPRERLLLYGDESGRSAPLPGLLASLPKEAPCGVLIGPEGGFSAEEHRMLQAATWARGFGMGPRILRADTAAVAALACLMARLGDWHEPPHFIAKD
jgi:16S rRNA (uracil1498-N3)-methyltransferase